MMTFQVVLLGSLFCFGLVYVSSGDAETESCNVDDRDGMEDICENMYDDDYTKAMASHPSENRNEQVCCALESLELCSIAAYYKSGCESEIPALRESLKAARLFTAVISNVSCAEFRGRCNGASNQNLALWLFILPLVPLLVCSRILFLN